MDVATSQKAGDAGNVIARNGGRRPSAQMKKNRQGGRHLRMDGDGALVINGKA